MVGISLVLYGVEMRLWMERLFFFFWEVGGWGSSMELLRFLVLKCGFGLEFFLVEILFCIFGICD